MTQNSKAHSIIKTRKKVADIFSHSQDSNLQQLFNFAQGSTYRSLLAQLAIENPCRGQERKIAAKMTSRLRSEESMANLLAAMLYHRAYDLRFSGDIRAIPEWFLTDYVRYMGCPIYMYHTAGEAQCHVSHMMRWVDNIHDITVSDPDDKFTHQLISIFLSETDFGPLYFNDLNLKALYYKRGKIIQYYLTKGGHIIDHTYCHNQTDNRPIRIGIAANHFAPHPETFATLPIYEHLDHTFHKILYSFTRSGSETEKYCSSRAHELKLLPTLLDDQVKLIREDDLDLLFIATNITSVASPICLLAAHRLARTQIAGVGSVTTTGFDSVDYYLTGALSDLKENEAHYTEKLAWLPGSAHCFSYGPLSQPTRPHITRQQLGIDMDKTVFVSGANMLKISPELIDAWAKILKSVPDAVLMLFPYGPNWASSYPKDSFTKHLQKVFKLHKVSFSRVLIQDPHPVPTREDIKEYLRITDIYLDSFPFSGTTSFIEPLEIGLPVITMKGASLRNRMGAALLIALGMNNLVAKNPASYIQSAVELGNNSDLRSSTREKIIASIAKPPEFLDSRKYSSNVAKIFKTIVHSTRNSHINDNPEDFHT